MCIRDRQRRKERARGVPPGTEAGAGTQRSEVTLTDDRAAAPELLTTGSGDVILDDEAQRNRKLQVRFSGGERSAEPTTGAIERE